MSLLTCASNASIWRGYDYYEEKKVLGYEKMDDDRYIGIVEGSDHTLYRTIIDVAHPRKSTCDCPHADGKRIICKHMMALFFTVFPKEAEELYNEAIKYQEEEEHRQEEQTDRIIKYVQKMKKDALCQALLEVLFDGPEWQLERFVRENNIKIY